MHEYVVDYVETRDETKGWFSGEDGQWRERTAAEKDMGFAQRCHTHCNRRAREGWRLVSTERRVGDYLTSVTDGYYLFFEREERT